MMSIRRLISLLLGAALLGFGVMLTAGHSATAFTLAPCHDDTHTQRNWTHGNPNDGTFHGGPPNHSGSYYYLDAQTASGCGVGADGLYHFVGHVSIAGPLADGSPGGVGNPKRTAVSSEMPAWGFEYKDPGGAILQPCAGGDGSGGNNCPQHPDAITVTGTNVAEWRYDGHVSGVRFRVDNQYDETLWEFATLDLVPCASCEPGGGNAWPSPSASPSPTGSSSGGSGGTTSTPAPSTATPAPSWTPTPSPTSTPTPAPSDSPSPSPTDSGSPSPSPSSSPGKHKGKGHGKGNGNGGTGTGKGKGSSNGHHGHHHHQPQAPTPGPAASQGSLQS